MKSNLPGLHLPANTHPVALILESKPVKKGENRTKKGKKKPASQSRLFSFIFLLPNPGSFFCGDVHFVPLLNIKSIIPGINIHYSTVCTIHTGRMRIGFYQLLL